MARVAHISVINFARSALHLFIFWVTRAVVHFSFIIYNIYNYKIIYLIADNRNFAYLIFKNVDKKNVRGIINDNYFNH